MRLIAGKSGQQGVSIIEVMVSVTILVILLMVGMPGFSLWLQNTKIRTGAEAILAGLQLARNEAVRRNAVVSFHLVNNFTSSCTLASNSGNWIVSLADPTSNCHIGPSETLAPRIVQSRAAVEGSTDVTVAAVNSVGVPATFISFNGLGRMTASTQIAQIDIDSSVLAATDSRDLRIFITPGGQVRMCDPNVSSTTDPRFC
jgi:type IV fimbrial biogenesis protein FimT